MDFYETYNQESSSNTLHPREHVRKRPGMYIGGIDLHALHRLVYEVLDHMVEEASVDRCDHIWIELRADNEISIRDNSQGLSMAQYKDSQFTQMEVLLQGLGISKSTFEPDIYHVTGGLHGFGLPIVNVLSDRFTVENCRDGILWRQTYECGKPTSPLTQIHDRQPETGTIFVLHPDFTIFEKNDFDLSIIEDRAKVIASLMPDLTVEVRDLRVEPIYETTFYYPEGLKTWVSQVNSGNRVFHEPVHIRENVIIPRTDRPDLIIGIEIAFQFSDGQDTCLHSYANTVETPAGGTHLTALKAALLSCINEYIEDFGHVLENKQSFAWDGIAPGLAAAVSIYHPDPHYVGNIKTQLGNSDIFGPIAGLVYRSFSGLMAWNRIKVIESIVEHHQSRRSETDQAD